FNCFGEPQCEAGRGAGLGAAVTDWHGGLYAYILNSGDYNCWKTYSDPKHHRLIHGYIYKWTQLWVHEHNMTKNNNNHNRSNYEQNYTTRATTHTIRITSFFFD